jgi:hypothetical protein
VDIVVRREERLSKGFAEYDRGSYIHVSNTKLYHSQEE